MQSPLFFDGSYGGLFPDIESLYFMFLQKFSNCRVKEVQLPQDISNIKLIADLLTGIEIGLGRFPILAPAAQIKKGFDGHEHKVEKVEGL